MKKIKNLIKDKRGNGNVILFIGFWFLAVVIGILCLAYVSYITTTEHIVNTTQDSLDKFTSAVSVDILNSIKSGNDYTQYLDESEYEKMIAEALNTGNDLICYTESEMVKYQISHVKLDFIKDDELKTTATYHLYMPIYFAGQEVTAIDDDISIQSRYNLKELP